jgi:hypothetical protein
MEPPKSVGGARPLWSAPVVSTRAIYTSPSKVGGPGFPISERTLGRTTFQYFPDEYLRGRTLDKTLKSKARERINAPFIGSATAKSATFTSNADLYGYASHIRQYAAVPKPPEEKPWAPVSKRSPRSQGLFSAPSHMEERPFGGAAGLALRDGSIGPPRAKPMHPPFCPAGNSKRRLSMWSPNHFASPVLVKAANEVY